MSKRSGQPWNKGRPVGARLALAQTEISNIRRELGTLKSSHDLCLFMTAVDTMLRASDLLQLRVRDVQHPDGSIRQTFPWKQKKTAKPVYPVLTAKAQAALRRWISESGKRETDYLFTREKLRTSKPISVGFYRTLIKSWVRLIGRPPHDYGAHSLRRSKAIFMYERGVAVEYISRLLGHSSPASTLHYLGITEAETRKRALQHDIFKRCKVSKTAAPFQFSETDLDHLGDVLWERLGPKLTNLLKNTEPNK